MNKLLSKLQGNSKLQVGTLQDSELFRAADSIPTDMPVLNLAFSGELDKGFRSGLIQFAGPSKHFKSNLSLICVKAYLDKYKDAVCIFYDSEFGITPEYLVQMGIDPNKVIHTPIKTVEELKFDLISQLDTIEKKDKVIILIDSVGNLASKKELEDAQNEKSVGDMSRSKSIKSLFRMVTPYLTLKDIPLIAINHTYQSQDFMPKTIVSGGTGIMYSSNVVLVIGRQQEKDSDGVQGWNFVLNVEKSRDVKEKSKLSFLVLYEDGIQKYSGLLDIGLAANKILKPSNGWYSRILNGIQEDKKWRKADTNNKEFWDPLLKDEEFQTACRKIYKLGAAANSKSTELEDDININDEMIDMSDVPTFDDSEDME